MNLPRSAPAARTLRLARKELREILRDRRTIITLVLMPLLVYPLLGVMVRRGLLSSFAALNSASTRIAVESDEEGTLFQKIYHEGGQWLHEEGPSRQNRPDADGEGDDTSASRLEFLQPDRRSEPEIYVLDASDPNTSLEQNVQSGQFDLGIRAVDDNHWQIIRRPDSQLSERVWREVTCRFEAWNRKYISDRLAERGLRITPPLSFRTELVETESKSRSSLITFIPLMLVLMTMTGAVYPAIDLTAGERERGTMEILVSAPVSRITLLAGKFLAVLVVALLTATVNMVSMFATLFTLQLDSAVLEDRGLTVIPLIILLMVVFAAFFSAVLLSLTSVARSFKEAQAYLIPLMLISLTPGVFSLAPDLTMGPLLAVTPLVNIVLTGRDLLQDSVNPGMFFIVLVSTAFYGMLALTTAARIFGSDSVLYGSTGSWTGLFQRSKAPQQTASVATAALSLAIVFPLFIIAGSIPARIADGLTQQLVLNGIVSLLVFVIVPVAIAVAARVRVSSGFALHGFRSPLALPAAVLLGLSLWGVVFELNLFIHRDESVETLRRLLGDLIDRLAAVPLYVKLAAMAVAPALCEELFFRGFLQTALRRRYHAAAAIVVSAVSFGLFHIIVRDGLLVERMIPSTFMGLVLGLMLERSGSVLPGMLLHTLHNGLLLAVSHYEEELKELGIGVHEQSHLPAGWLVGIGLVVASGTFCLWKMSPRSHGESTE